MRLNILIFVSLFLLVRPGYGQEKGAKPVSKTTMDTSAIDLNRRIALVIGNEKYGKDSLRNPVNDANRMTAVLKKYGFNVIQKNDLGRKELNSVINEFGDSILAKKGVSFFYYSGHGLQYNSENYLLPVKSAIEKESDIEDEAVKLGKVFEKMKRTGNGLNFVVLDACRNNPYNMVFPGLPKGLTDKEALPGNTSVFFATSPGNVALDGTGTNSPFTESLAETITDSIEFYQVVRKVVKQVKAKTNAFQQPSITGSPEDEFYFTRRKGKPRLFVVSIGNSQYQNAPSLKFAGKDARDIVTSFNKQEGALYDSVYTALLINTTVPDIRNAIRSLRQKVQPGDVIVLFLAGQIVYDEKMERSFFLPVDAKINTYNDLIEQGIVFQYFQVHLTSLPCKSVLFLQGSYQSRSIDELNTTENGMAIFASSKPGQENLDLENKEGQNGLFAHFLIKGLSGAAAESGTGHVTLSSLEQYLKKNVSDLSKGKQTPVVYYPPGFSRFTLTKSIK